MNLTPRQEKHIAKIIEREVSWMVGWHTPEHAQRKRYQNSAEKIIRYINRCQKSTPVEEYTGLNVKGEKILTKVFRK